MKTNINEAIAPNSLSAEAVEILAILKQGAKETKGKHLLDVGCGDGRITVELSPYFETASGIDACQHNIGKAKTLSGNDTQTNYSFVHQDICLPFNSAKKYDAIICLHAFHHFSNPQIALINMQTNLNADGLLFVKDNICPQDNELDVFINTLRKLRDASCVKDYNKSEWHLLFENAGLEIQFQKTSKSTVEIKNWLEHSKLSPAQKESIKKHLINASAHCQNYFQIQYNKNEPVSYSFDRLTVLAKKYGV